jgi:glucose/arabinose dehydrogenase
MRKIYAVTLLSLLAAPALNTSVWAAEPDNLILPPGFHATVVADGILHARHMAIRANGDIYVSTRVGNNDPAAGIIAIRPGPDHKAVDVQHFSDIDNGTGIRLSGNTLYTSSATAVYRFDLSGNALVPTAAPQTVIDGMPTGGQLNRVLALDGKGNLFLSVSGSGNLCTAPTPPATPGTPPPKPVGLKPCPSLTGRSGIWRFDAAKTGQKFPADGVQLATGVRDIDALDFAPEQSTLYAIMHDRNGGNAAFPELISPADEANVAEEMHRITLNTDLGWPYTYYDGARKIRLLAPEYGGDGKTAAVGNYDVPAYAFAGHQAPLDMVFYEGKQFPAKYRGGAFVAFHGGNGPHLATGHQGYDVMYVPFDAKGQVGTPEVFADGFAGVGPDAKNVDSAIYRPVGLAVAPDGSLYVADGQKGRIWRIAYDGK